MKRTDPRSCLHYNGSSSSLDIWVCSGGSRVSPAYVLSYRKWKYFDAMQTLYRSEFRFLPKTLCAVFLIKRPTGMITFWSVRGVSIKVQRCRWQAGRTTELFTALSATRSISPINILPALPLPCQTMTRTRLIAYQLTAIAAAIDLSRCSIVRLRLGSSLRLR